MWFLHTIIIYQEEKVFILSNETVLMKLLPFNHSGENFQLYICLFKCTGRDYKFMINQDKNNQTESILGGGRIYLPLY